MNMIKIDLPDISIALKFAHPLMAFSDDKGRPRNQRLTHCQIFRLRDTSKPIHLVTKDDTVPLASGIALCAIGDQFNKAKGRKIALTRALAISNLGKFERGKIWDTYFAKVNR